MRRKKYGASGIETKNRGKVTRQDVIDFAKEIGLDVVDACECYDATVERKGCDSEGKPIKNWKGFVRQWCETRKINREKGN